MGGLGAAHAAAHLEAVGPRQHDVEHHERGTIRGDLGERALTAVGLTHGVSLLLEMESDELADVLLVLDNQDGSLDRHGYSCGSSLSARCDARVTGG